MDAISGEPALEFEVWRDAIGNAIPFYAEDEMVKEMGEYGASMDEFIPASQRSSAAANPRCRKVRTKQVLRVKLKPAGLSPMQGLKRKLMR